MSLIEKMEKAVSEGNAMLLKDISPEDKEIIKRAIALVEQNKQMMEENAHA